jgi:hypothetical protein
MGRANRAGKLGLVLVCLGLVLPLSAKAGEAFERKLLHPEAVFVLEVQKPLDWAKHPTLNRVWSAISQTRQVKNALETPEFQRVLAARDFLQSASGQEWHKALAELTQGGIWVGVTPKPNERATLIIAAANAEAWTKLESSLLSTLKSLGQEPPASKSYRDIKTYRIEKSSFAIVGHRLIAASDEADLKRMIDELVKHANAEPAVSTNGPPSFSLAVDWKTVRKLPDLQKAYARPSSDAGQVALLGGWLDVLGSTDRLTANLSWPENSTEIVLNLTAIGVDADVPLFGFFAQSPNDVLAPLLDPPGTIYSASWFRDYAALWDQRADVLTKESVEKMEKGDQDVRQQFSVFGVNYTPSEFFKQMGTEFRVVLARADKTDYRVELENRLPAAAVCVSLRDEEAFLKQAEPLSRAFGLIAAFGEAKMLTKTSEHSQAKLKGFWFRDDEKAAEKGNRLRYNFNPTWTVAREHFIFGSTRDIVAKVIDELDRQAAEPETALTSLRVTDRQLVSFTELSQSLTDFREALLEGTALDRGFRLSDAITELNLAQDAINALGRLTTEAAFTEQGFEYQIKLQPETSRSEGDREQGR